MPLSRSNILIVEDQAIIVLRKSPRQALTGQVPPQDSLMRRRSLAIRETEPHRRRVAPSRFRPGRRQATAVCNARRRTSNGTGFTTHGASPNSDRAS